MRTTRRQLRKTIRRVLTEMSVHSQMDGDIKNIILYAAQEASGFMKHFGQNIVFEELNAMSDLDILTAAGWDPNSLTPDGSNQDMVDYLIQSTRSIAADKNELKRVLFELVDEEFLVHNPDGTFSMGDY